MARTKQTAGNSTGGPAKRGHLPRFKKVTGHAGKQLIKTVQATSPRAKIVLKPSSHNIVSLITPRSVTVTNLRTFISSVSFAATVASYMTAPYAHAQFAIAVSLFRQSFRSVLRTPAFILFVQGAMKCVQRKVP